MSELDDVVAATAETLSGALMRLSKSAPREQAVLVSETLSEAAQDLNVAATSTDAPPEYVGWAGPVSDTKAPDTLPPEWG